MDLQVLQAELTADPLARNYAGMTDQQAADALNAVNRTVIRAVMTGSEVADGFDATEFGGLTDVKKARAMTLAGIDRIDPQGFAQRVVVEIFGAGSQTVSNLAAARQRTISRAEELGLPFVNGGDVHQVRGG